MKIIAIIGVGFAAVLLIGYLLLRKLGGGEPERSVSRTWEGPSSDWRNSSGN